jgi:hypothetical protein
MELSDIRAGSIDQKGRTVVSVESKGYHEYQRPCVSLEIECRPLYQIDTSDDGRVALHLMVEANFAEAVGHALLMEARKSRETKVSP